MEIIGVIVAGIIIGLLGKFVAPSTRNNIPLWLTIICGIGAVIIGWYIYILFGGTGTPGIDWIRWLFTVVVAAIVVVIANAIATRSKAKRTAKAISYTGTATPDADESVGEEQQARSGESTPDDGIEDGLPRGPISSGAPEPNARATHEEWTAELQHRQVAERRASTESRAKELGKVFHHKSQGIFLSYRREDAAPYARLLQLQLTERFPTTQVFLDLDSIEAGLDFAEVIQRALNSSAVLVALIGDQWTTVVDDEGRRRLDNPDDYVRYEIQTALERGLRVIPVLVDGAKPLRRQYLPSELQGLTRLNALELSYGRFQYDADRLLGIIERVLAAAPTSD
jgi:uncharacterized membrane protein YeaQ/YmgE (transglycosylase-associated protein family)